MEHFVVVWTSKGNILPWKILEWEPERTGKKTQTKITGLNKMECD